MLAIPSLRGGGEFGEEWHQAGMLERKQNVFDDFIGAAEWLIGNGYTSQDRIAVEGGSNGGLLVDGGLIAPRATDALTQAYRPADPLVVEWRALTVAGLDRIAARVRTALGHDTASLPLGAVLQGGTWSAGRRLARARRADGGPPVVLVSDGTVF